MPALGRAAERPGQVSRRGPSTPQNQGVGGAGAGGSAGAVGSAASAGRGGLRTVRNATTPPAAASTDVIIIAVMKPSENSAGSR